MDPPLIHESSFSAANPSAYSLTEIWPFSGGPGNGGLGLQMGNVGGLVDTRDGSVENSSVTDQNSARKRKEEPPEMVSTSSANNLVSFLFALICPLINCGILLDFAPTESNLWN